MNFLVFVDQCNKLVCNILNVAFGDIFFILCAFIELCTVGNKVRVPSYVHVLSEKPFKTYTLRLFQKREDPVAVRAVPYTPNFKAFKKELLCHIFYYLQACFSFLEFFS